MRLRRTTTAPGARVASPGARTGDVRSPMCPSRAVLEHVTSRWGVLVLIILLEGTHRFNELRRTIANVSDKMLAQTLQALEADGFVTREVYAVVPPRVEYTLTAAGREIAVRVEALTDWIETNMGQIAEAREQAARRRAPVSPAPVSRVPLSRVPVSRR
jgi:DNA-binding HxlR family transcriptional regulator